MIYLDAAATIPTSSDVQDRIVQTLRNTWGTVSGAHQVSRKAKNLLEQSREDCAQLLGVSPDNIVYSSGSTEALNMVIQGYVRAHHDARILYSAIEHSAVAKPAQYFSTFGHTVISLGVDSSGIVNDNELDQIQAGDLVCVLPVNNEIGVVNDVRKIADVVHARGAVILLDCVQSLYVFDPREMCEIADYAVFSSHKIGGPSGVGLLMIKDRKSIDPLSFGGGQEWELRPGTTPTYLIDAFTYAFTQAVNNRNDAIVHLTHCYDVCLAAIDEQLDGVEIHSRSVACSPHIVALNIADIEAQMLVTMLDARGVCVSRGSACASGASTPSSVLLALGLSESQTSSTIRLSFSVNTQSDEITEAVGILADCVAQLRTKQSVEIS